MISEEENLISNYKYFNTYSINVCENINNETVKSENVRVKLKETNIEGFVTGQHTNRDDLYNVSQELLVFMSN